MKERKHNQKPKWQRADSQIPQMIPELLLACGDAEKSPDSINSSLSSRCWGAEGKAVSQREPITTTRLK